MRRYGLNSCDSGSGLSVASCEYDHVTSGSITFWGIPEWLSDCWLLKNNSAPES
jgi:hypothetical protein